jgi:hypothetical protein
MGDSIPSEMNARHHLEKAQQLEKEKEFENADWHRERARELVNDPRPYPLMRLRTGLVSESWDKHDSAIFRGGYQVSEEIYCNAEDWREQAKSADEISDHDTHEARAALAQALKEIEFNDIEAAVDALLLSAGYLTNHPIKHRKTTNDRLRGRIGALDALFTELIEIADELEMAGREHENYIAFNLGNAVRSLGYMARLQIRGEGNVRKALDEGENSE